MISRDSRLRSESARPVSPSSSTAPCPDAIGEGAPDEHARTTDVDSSSPGGISGLATAFDLQRRGVAVDVLDAATRAGGVIGTTHRDGALVETGPNSALDTTPLINELLERSASQRAREANASPHAVHRPRRQACSAADVARRVPSTSAFTPGAKFRLWREPFVPPAPPDVEESSPPSSPPAGTEFSTTRSTPSWRAAMQGTGADLGFRRVPAPPCARAEVRQPDQGQFQGARERRRAPEGGQRGRQLLLPQRHADADRCARAGRGVITGVAHRTSRAGGRRQLDRHRHARRRAFVRAREERRACHPGL